MEGFKLYNHKSIAHFISGREGEIKFGEKVSFIKDFNELEDSKARYVLFGIPEDIGIRGNLGKPGASKAWDACLKSLLNVQANQYTNPENVILLGEVDCKEFMFKAANIDLEDPNYFEKLGELVSKLDTIVSNVVERIISAGKIPVILGGGHNNAYGAIKGAFKALNKPVNILNIDAHTDLRKTDYRHSGNAFSFARKENILGKYRVFGLHQNYTPDYIFKKIIQSQNDHFRLFEHLTLKSSESIIKAFQEELDFTAQEDFGLELDCDVIKDFPSSAQSPTGFPINMVRNFIKIASEEKNIRYLHICEAAPQENQNFDVGKALSYFVIDFMQQKE
ncbi:formimidoylglutamase [Gillisia limnaea]|uniref:Arginase/agmatinase/formiminoglutamase n=1 Tax=Gillisia limnaea (strain DSM 15749 / LMG 21470 / R-8282) TaxID=865937 RepID=H2BTZ1_GILLR|nr:arginase family protein [Gillisia limnaea]EHQ03805.1 Arginase/agmatinase/formiminoglutamase [Gillisia limnaea DSM 15749]